MLRPIRDVLIFIPAAAVGAIAGVAAAVLIFMSPELFLPGELMFWGWFSCIPAIPIFWFVWWYVSTGLFKFVNRRIEAGDENRNAPP